jgi:hypothetical protein
MILYNHNLTEIVLTMLAFYWNKLDYHTRALMPWKLMSEKPQSADQSLLLDYVSGNVLIVLLGSIRHGHVAVITSAIGSLMIILITVFSTGLFVLQPTMMHKNTTISVLSVFDGSQFNTSAVDSFPVLAASSILSGNLSIAYPPDTNMDYAVASFSVKPLLDGQSRPIFLRNLTDGIRRSGRINVWRRRDVPCRSGL